MPFLRNVKDLRGIKCGKTYLYSVRIEGAPPPFNNFLPAQEVTIPSSSIESFSFSSYNSTFSVPYKELEKPIINITMIDDVDLTLKRYLEEWMSDILPENGAYVATLETAVKTLFIQRLDNFRDVVEQRAYTVYPVGRVEETLSSEGSLATLSMGFQVVGILEV